MGAVNDFTRNNQLPVVSMSTQEAIQVSCVTRERFADLTGLSAPTVFGMCDRGYLPTVHFGRRVFVNLEVLRSQCAAKALS